MNTYKLTLLKGDGIGPEIVREAVKVLDAAAARYGFALSYTDALMGGCAIDAAGTPLPEETVAACKQSDAVLLGAVGGYKWDTLPGNQRPEAGLLGIRSALGLFANLRPAKIYGPLKDACPLRPSIVGDDMDLLVVRELTGGIYFGRRGRDSVDGAESAYDTERYSVPEVERIARVAFDTARRRRGLVHSVDKANVLDSSRLWRDVVNEVAKDYPQVALSHMLVDNCAMQLVKDPAQFDVILTENMFGDILTDEASVITGSLGMLPSASIGVHTSVFEPIHGSYPQAAGKNIANPLATILSAALMFEYAFNGMEEGALIREAVAASMDANIVTEDIAENGKAYKTSEVGDWIAEYIAKK